MGGRGGEGGGDVQSEELLIAWVQLNLWSGLLDDLL